jgi:hypothetical protein
MAKPFLNLPPALNMSKYAPHNKSLERYRDGTNLVLLDPDVAAAFPDAKAVNDALRLLLCLKKAEITPKLKPDFSNRYEVP